MALDASSVGVFVFRADGSCLLANRAAVRLVGEGRPLDYRALVSWEACGLRGFIDAVVDTGTPRSGELRMMAPPGRMVWLSYDVAPVDLRGRRHVVLSLEDVTDRTMALEELVTYRSQLHELVRQGTGELRESRERLLEAEFVAMVGSWSWEPEGREFRPSPGFYRLHDIDPDEEAPIERLFERIVPGDRWAAEVLRRALERLEPFETDYRIALRGGELRDVHARGRLVRVSDDEGPRLVGSCQDITDRNLTGNRLAARMRLVEYAATHTVTELLRRTLDELAELTGSQIGFYHHVREDQRTLRLQAWSTRTEREFCRADGRGHVYDLDLAGVWADCLREGRPIIHNDYPSLANRRGLPEGHAPVTRELTVPIYRGGKAVAIVGVGNKPTPYTDADVESVQLIAEYTTEIAARMSAEGHLRETLAELRRSNEELEQFAYVASHDLQEPLRMVASFTQLIAERYRGRLDDKADTYIRFAVDGARRMQGLINDLLSLSRVGTRGEGPAPAPSGEVLAVVLEGLRQVIGETGATLQVDSLPTVLCDRVQLGQVFQNLIENAIKFRGERPPEIRVSAAPRGDDWVFSVEDNGVGIDASHFERVFVIFQRLHSREQHPGNGIGLALVRKIVERHGGRVWVESTPGAGSQFHFTLRGAADGGGAP